MRFADKVENCNKCLELAVHRTNVVLGEGPIPCNLIFLGEGPGKTEDEVGLPFKGWAGQILRADADVAGLKEGMYHILNMVKCRPPENRDPTIEELRNCLPFLMHQLKVIRPKVIVCLGKFAQAFALQKPPGEIRVTRNAGKVVTLKRTISKTVKPKVVLTYHPSFVGRNRGNDIEYAFIKHLRKARRLACIAPNAR